MEIHTRNIKNYTVMEGYFEANIREIGSILNLTLSDMQSGARYFMVYEEMTALHALLNEVLNKGDG